MSMMLVAILSVGFASCGSDDDDGDEGSFSHSIVGTWDRDDRDGDTQITFKANMTAVLTNRDEGVTSTVTGDYKIDDNRFTIHWTKASSQGMTMDVDLTESGLFEIDGDKMTTTAPDGDQVKWTRK